MPDPRRTVMLPVARQCRLVSASLIAAIWRTRSAAQIDAALDRLPVARQTGVVASVLALLFLFSLFAAQFGLIGLALFWLAVVLIIS